MDNNQNGKAGSLENAAPELVEVDVDGKKVKVEKGAESFLMKDADYRKKTAMLADERRALLAEKESLKAKLDAADNIGALLSSHERASDVLALLAEGKVKEAKSLLDENDEGDSKLVKLERELADLKGKLVSKLANDQESAKRTAQYAEAKRIVKENFNKDLDEYYPKMAELAHKNPNPHIPWFTSAALSELIESAEKKGKELGKQEALEAIARAENTPPTSSGYGVDGKGNKKATSTAAESAFNRIREEKLRRAGL